MGKSVVDAESISKEEAQNREIVSDVHIGVFFEGSGLNMENEVKNPKNRDRLTCNVADVENM